MVHLGSLKLGGDHIGSYGRGGEPGNHTQNEATQTRGSPLATRAWQKLSPESKAKTTGNPCAVPSRCVPAMFSAGMLAPRTRKLQGMSRHEFSANSWHVAYGSRINVLGFTSDLLPKSLSFSGLNANSHTLERLKGKANAPRNMNTTD